MKKLLTLALPVALVAFAGTACSGSDSGAQNDAWAKSLCGGAQTPIEQAQAALADTGTVKQNETPVALQTRLAGDLGTLAAANAQLAAAVNNAGVPRIDKGAQVQQGAVSELRQAAGGYQGVQQKVLALPTGDQAKFADGLKSVSDQVQQLSNLSSGALNSLQTGTLGAAVAKQPGCKSVNGTAGAGATTATSPAAASAVAGASVAVSSSPNTPAAGASSRNASGNTSEKAAVKTSAGASMTAASSASAR